MWRSFPYREYRKNHTSEVGIGWQLLRRNAHKWQPAVCGVCGGFEPNLIGISFLTSKTERHPLHLFLYFGNKFLNRLLVLWAYLRELDSLPLLLCPSDDAECIDRYT